ncbi:MAG: enoyl-CoA hydratase/isomerase family protein, partial [Actinomycetota bacterium]
MALVETEHSGSIATLTLSRPQARNALSIELCDAIATALDGISGDARVVVLRGAGKAFCSGADFAAISGPGGTEFVPVFERMLEAVARHRLPTIAAIQGAALGGGLQLATVCDFRVAASDARLGIPSTTLGIVVNFENVQRLALLVGLARAKEVLMTGRTYSGVEAESAGLVNRSVAPQDLDAEVGRLADAIAALAPLSVQGAKVALQAIADHVGATRSTHPKQVAAVDRLVA